MINEDSKGTILFAELSKKLYLCCAYYLHIMKTKLKLPSNFWTIVVYIAIFLIYYATIFYTAAMSCMNGECLVASSPVAVWTTIGIVMVADINVTYLLTLLYDSDVEHRVMERAATIYGIRLFVFVGNGIMTGMGITVWELPVAATAIILVITLCHISYVVRRLLE